MENNYFFFGTFISDSSITATVLSVIRRLISGRPVFTADREHIHHKLLQHGMTHRQVNDTSDRR